MGTVIDLFKFGDMPRGLIHIVFPEGLGAQISWVIMFLCICVLAWIASDHILAAFGFKTKRFKEREIRRAEFEEAERLENEKKSELPLEEKEED